MAREVIPGLGGVTQVFGQAFTGGATGSIKTEGSKNEIAINLTGEVLATRILQPVRIPAGSVIKRATLRVVQAFDLAGTAVVRVGTSGAEAANGVSMTEVQLETVGYADVTASLNGTFAANAVLAADTLLGVAITAGTLTNRTVGKAVLVIETERVIA